MAEGPTPKGNAGPGEPQVTVVTKEASPSASRLKGHLSAFASNACFGVGSVVVGLALGTISPMYYALLRCVATTFIFLLMAKFQGLPLSDCWLVVTYGFTMFLSQAGYAIGLKLSSPVLAAVWQPTQPIFTLVIVTILGLEPFSVQKSLGVGLSFSGCAYIVGAKPDSGDSGSTTPLWVHSFFVLACLGSSGMVLTLKSLVGKGHGFAPVVGWSSFVCACFLLVATMVAHSDPQMLAVLCPGEGCGDGWELPPGFIYIFIYVVIGMTVVPYSLNTIAARNLEGSVVSVYTVAQPIVAGLATVVAKSLLPDSKLKLPDESMLYGGALIFAGLALVASAKVEKDQ